MHITCPGCSIPYELPPHLIGPAGARVCCPACRLTFVLAIDGRLVAVLARAQAATLDPALGENGAGPQSETAPPAPAADAVAPAAQAPPHATPSLAAVRALDDPPGTLAAAAAAGRLFADHGPALLDAFEALADAAPDADVAAQFRSALLEVAGVELSAAAAEPARADR